MYEAMLANVLIFGASTNISTRELGVVVLRVRWWVTFETQAKGI